MNSTTLIVPGLYGSGAEHWQSWMLSQITGARRVEQDDWSRGAIGTWAQRVRDSIDDAVGQVWLVAHSFGCLAAVTAAVDRADRVAGALLVAPANPERFATNGLLVAGETNQDPGNARETITEQIPHHALGFPAIVVASANDPWMRLTAASVWADRWGAQFECIGRAGHINVESGFGPWRQGLELFERFRLAHGGDPLGNIDALAEKRIGSRTHEVEVHARRGERNLERQWFG